MVTNPATRDWTVTASVFATLNEMYGNRTVCGIGRGDSAVRVTNGKPTTLATLRESIHVIRELANGRSVDYKGSTLAFPWAGTAELEVWVAGYGPQALALTGEVGDGFILQLADPEIAAWTIKAVRERRRAGRPRPRRRHDLRRRAGLRRRRRPRPTCATSAAGSAGWSATTSPTSSAATATSSACPTALTDYIKGRQGYDYNEHGQAGNTHADFVPDEIVDRFCILGPVDEQLHRLARAARSASTSSRSTSSTTPRTPRSRPTASTCCPRSGRRTAIGQGCEPVATESAAAVSSLPRRAVRSLGSSRRGSSTRRRPGRRRRRSSAGRSCRAPTTSRCRTCGTWSVGCSTTESRTSDRRSGWSSWPATWYSFRLAARRLRHRRRRRHRASPW